MVIRNHQNLRLGKYWKLLWALNVKNIRNCPPLNCKLKSGFRAILPCFEQVNLTWARDPNGKPAIGQRSASKKHVTLMSCKLEPAIWPRDTGQRIPCFDRCQLIVALLSNIKEVHSKPRPYVSTNLFWSMAAMLRDGRRRRAYAPTSNTASHDNHEKINSWVSFSFAWWVWGSAWRPFGPPELRYNSDGSSGPCILNGLLSSFIDKCWYLSRWKRDGNGYSL